MSGWSGRGRLSTAPIRDSTSEGVTKVRVLMTGLHWRSPEVSTICPSGDSVCASVGDSVCVCVDEASQSTRQSK